MISERDARGILILMKVEDKLTNGITTRNPHKRAQQATWRVKEEHVHDDSCGMEDRERAKDWSCRVWNGNIRDWGWKLGRICKNIMFTDTETSKESNAYQNVEGVEYTFPKRVLQVHCG